MSEWRTAHTITDWEFAQIGALLCGNAARDLALMVVRLQGQIEVLNEVQKGYEVMLTHFENAWLEQKG